MNIYIQDKKHISDKVINVEEVNVWKQLQTIITITIAWWYKDFIDEKIVSPVLVMCNKSPLDNNE